MPIVGRENGHNPKTKRRLRTAEPKVRVKKPSFLSSFENESPDQGLSILVYGPEGVGKSSLFAFADDVAFVCGRAEHGIHKLKKWKLVPETVAIGRDVSDWYGLLDNLDELIEDEHPYKFICLDSLTVFQQLCFKACCDEQFEGDWSKEGFLAFMQGPRTAASRYWPDLISRLDSLRERNIHVGMTAHSNVKPYKNPVGPDYDKFVADLSEPIWQATKRWCDTILYLAHNTEVNKEGKYTKFKGSGGEQRVLHCEFSAAFEAKNRFGLPPLLGPFDNAEQTWHGLWDAITGNASDEEKPRRRRRTRP